MLTRIRSHSPGSRVVVFTGMDLTEQEWITGQVEGYVGKDADLRYLVDLLEALGQPHATEAAIDLPHELTSVATARRFVTQQVTDWHAEQILADAVLVTSELTANAITHADSQCRIRLSLTDATLRIDVIDAGTGTPEPQPPTSRRSTAAACAWSPRWPPRGAWRPSPATESSSGPS